MPRNPLAEYIDRPAPYFDYTDAHTWYDGLWGGGQWPPEGIRGIGQFTPGFPPGFDPPVYFHTPVFFPGDRARIMAGLRGLGQEAFPTCASGETVSCPDYPDTSTCTCVSASPSSIPCLTGAYGPLRPGQVFCATGTTVSPGIGINTPNQPANQPTTGWSTQTVVMVGMSAAIVLLFFFAMRR